MALVRVDPNCAVPVGAAAEPLIAGADALAKQTSLVVDEDKFPASSSV